MIETVVTKLVDRCIQFLKERRARVRSEFSDFVQPTYEQCHAVHEGYLVSFRKYRDMLKKPHQLSETAHPVFEAINEDHVFSSGTRSKLSAMAKMLKGDDTRTRFFQDGDDLLMLPEMDPLSHMLWLIQRYISGTDRCIFYDALSFISNFPRSSLYSGLKFLATPSAESIRTMELDFGENCFDFAMRMSGVKVASPPLLTIRGDKAWSLVLKINSPAEWDNLKRRLSDSGDDIDDVKRGLAICLVDKIVSRNQALYGEITERFEELKAAHLKA
jgi:hypothetical protein